MRKLDLSFGLLLSALLHGAAIFLWTGPPGEEPTSTPDPPSVEVVARNPREKPPEPPQPPPEPAEAREPSPDRSERVDAPLTDPPAPAPVVPAPAAPRTTPPLPSLEEVVSVPAPKDPAPAPGATHAIESDADPHPLPPLRLDVSDPDLVVRAAERLGIRFALVDPSGTVCGVVENPTASDRTLRKADSLSGYSNRIRLLPRDGPFGEVLDDLAHRYPDTPGGVRLAMLIPAGTDARWRERQREFVRGRKRPRRVVARFVPASGTYDLQMEPVW